MRGWPEETIPDRDSESISKFIYSIHEKNLAWFLNDRLELNKEGGKVLTLEDFRELLMNHLTGVETFEHERANSQLPDHKLNFFNALCTCLLSILKLSLLFSEALQDAKASRRCDVILASFIYVC